jgi:hypothetical protein
MDINEKIQKAKEYVAIVGRNANEELHMFIRNRAANIFADSYEDYKAIYAALRKG